MLIVHSVNGSKFSNITALFILSAVFGASSSSSLVIVVIIYMHYVNNMHTSLLSHKSGLIIEVLNLMLLLLYFPHDSSFISTQFVVLS